MSITPPSDIVLDVARAADPARAQQAAAKLSQPGDPAAFAEAARAAGLDPERDAAAGTHTPLDAGAALTGLKNDTALKGADPYRKFEGLVLQQFVESMLPDKSETVYGKGNAGAIWKSMLAEQIGNQISKAGGLGIADMLNRAHPAGAGAGPATGVAGKA